MGERIAVFVSHRIDLPCETPQSSLYHPMRCGAVYDTGNATIPGDHTGEHISERRNSMCELTVQYWAWKNYDADYYGLCHYRRYFSFSDQLYGMQRFNVVDSDTISAAAKKYCLTDEQKMSRIITSHDAIIPTAIDIRTVLTGVPGGERFYPHSILEFWNAKVDQVDPRCVDALIRVVQEHQPEYYPALMEYLHGTTFYGGCCYIMRKELFNQLCEFQFSVLAELEKQFDMSSYTGEHTRQPAFMGEILYATFLIYLRKKEYKVREHQVVLFKRYQVAAVPTKAPAAPTKAPQVNMSKKPSIREMIRKMLRRIFPAYRVALRIEEFLHENAYGMLPGTVSPKDAGKSGKSGKPIAGVLAKTPWQKQTLTSDVGLDVACLALEIRDTHKASFSEFRNCHTGKNVVIVATGPSMRHYTQMDGMAHIGMNSAYKNDKIKLDYYFITDFENRVEMFQDLKEYDFVKFFGQYSAGIYRDRFQASEQMIFENKGRRFFQGAPSMDIHVNIEYYPLMAFYSVAFQAIHFALYTNAKRIFLVGCDCSSDGYFDGSQQIGSNPPKWVLGYQKLKTFVEHFYPETEIISVNPVGLKGLFHDVYTESYLDQHPEIDRTQCEILKPELYEE
ncbi:MAG: DUF4422 domain-containing protein [Oscillospiraceae bacterium]|nr:DUF4422 domain-containing protein [Oscillospiraceae bacterium]